MTGSDGGPSWIFRWRGLDGPVFPKVVAFFLTVLAFGVFVSFVRVEVVPPPGWEENKGAVIQLPGGAEGRVWRLLALEGGPSAVRFDPKEWAGAAALEELALNPVSPEVPYRPELMDLPQDGAPGRVATAPVGRPVFPERSLTPLPPTPTPEPGERRLMPVLNPLSGIGLEEMPEELPPLPELDPAARGVDWRFMLLLGPGGVVRESISLEGVVAPGVGALEGWLRSLRFPKKPEGGWVGLRVEFTQIAADGSDAE